MTVFHTVLFEVTVGYFFKAHLAEFDDGCVVRGGLELLSGPVGIEMEAKVDVS